MTIKNIENKLKNPSVSLLIFGLSMFGYLAAYVFQYGYLKFFDISYKFIDINIPWLIIGIVFTNLIFLYIDYFTRLYKTIIQVFDHPNPLNRLVLSFIRVVPISIFFILFIQGIGVPSESIIIYTILFSSTIIVVHIIFPLIFHLVKERQFLKAVVQMYKSIDSEINDNPDVRSFGDKYSGTILMIIAFLIIALTAGRHYANMQNGMYVIIDKGDVKSLLIQKNGDTYILKDYNTVKNSFEDGFTIARFQETITLKERVMIKLIK